MRRYLDLLVVLVLAGAGAILVIAPISIAWLRAVLAAPMVLFAPGYAISAAAAGGRRVNWPERLLLSLGLSIMVVILGGLALNLTPWKLRVDTWVVFLAGLTLVACVIALVRRHHAPAAPREAAPSVNIRLGQVLIVGLAVVVAAGAIGVARTPLPGRDIQGYTLLWALPGEGENACTIRYGMTSGELTSTAYRLEILRNSQPFQIWPVITLAPGDKWEQSVQVPPDLTGKSVLVNTVLYLVDKPGVVYRQVTLRCKP